MSAEAHKKHDAEVAAQVQIDEKAKIDQTLKDQDAKIKALEAKQAVEAPTAKAQ
jgi:hypothetical protein